MLHVEHKRESDQFEEELTDSLPRELVKVSLMIAKSVRK
jgi:hypothetical protein